MTNSDLGLFKKNMSKYFFERFYLLIAPLLNLSSSLSETSQMVIDFVNKDINSNPLLMCLIIYDTIVEQEESETIW